MPYQTIPDHTTPDYTTPYHTCHAIPYHTIPGMYHVTSWHVPHVLLQETGTPDHNCAAWYLSSLVRGMPAGDRPGDFNEVGQQRCAPGYILLQSRNACLMRLGVSYVHCFCALQLIQFEYELQFAQCQVLLEIVFTCTELN